MTKRRIAFALACCLLLAGIPAVRAASLDAQVAAAAARHARSVTVYVDATWGNRTNGMAKALNEAHDAFAAHGYVLVDVSAYVENGDLQGFFVSYAADRAVPGPAAGAAMPAR